MSLTMHRVIQYIVIIILCALAGGGYWYWKDQQAKASVTEKSSDTTGLVGYWSFDEGSGTTAEDFSPAGNNTGTLTNSPTWVDGKVGKALKFNGTSQYVKVADATSLRLSSGAFSVSFWIKPNSTTGGTVIGKQLYGAWHGWTIGIGDNSGSGCANLAIGVTINSGWACSSAVMTVGEWQHVIVTYDGISDLWMYRNGVLFYAGGGSSPVSSTAALYIGNSFDSSGTPAGSYSPDSIDEVRIYSRKLSAPEITNLYQESVGSKVNTTENSELTSGLVGLWSFNGADVSGITAYDRSGNGNNGTLTNGPAVTLGKIGQALSFDGVNDYVTIPDAAVLRKGSGSLSLSLWANPKNQNQSMSFLTKRQSGGSYEQYGVGVCGTDSHNWPSGKRICFTFIESVSSIERSGYTNIDVADGHWHHIVVVADSVSDAIRVYVDGVNVSVTMDFSSGAWPVIDNTDPLEIGRNLYYDSSLDEVRVYNRAISATEVWNLYQMGGGARVNSANSQSDSLERGLSGYWKLDDASGTTATDASTNGNNGTLTNGPTWTTGQIGGAVSFDGVDDYIIESGTTQYKFTSHFSFGGWFKSTGDEDNRVVAGFDSGSADRYNLVIDNAGAEGLGCNVRLTGGLITASLGVTVATNSWYHLYCVYDDSLKVVTLYVNGAKLAISSVGSGSITDGGSGLQKFAIGRSNGSTYTWWAGIIDEVRMYSRALSPEEVAKLYKSTAPDNPDTSLKGYWSFNGPDVSGTTAFDRSGVGNNGTLTSGPVVTPGKVGQALSFDGVNDYVSMGDVNAIDSASTLTLSVWLKRRAVNSILTVGKSEAQTRTFNINAYNDGKIYVNVGDGGLNTYGSFTSNDTDWHHVVFVFDGNLSGNANRAKAYLDGVAQSLTFSQTIPAATQASADIFTVGRDTALSTFSTGNIDEVRVYSRAFTQTEVTNLYNLGR